MAISMDIQTSRLGTLDLRIPREGLSKGGELRRVAQERNLASREDIKRIIASWMGGSEVMEVMGVRRVTASGRLAVGLIGMIHGITVEAGITAMTGITGEDFKMKAVGTTEEGTGITGVITGTTRLIIQVPTST